MTLETASEEMLDVSCIFLVRVGVDLGSTARTGHLWVGRHGYDPTTWHTEARTTEPAAAVNSRVSVEAIDKWALWAIQEAFKRERVHRSLALTHWRAPHPFNNLDAHGTHTGFHTGFYTWLNLIRTEDQYSGFHPRYVWLRNLNCNSRSVFLYSSDSFHLYFVLSFHLKRTSIMDKGLNSRNQSYKSKNSFHKIENSIPCKPFARMRVFSPRPNKPMRPSWRMTAFAALTYPIRVSFTWRYVFMTRSEFETVSEITEATKPIKAWRSSFRPKLGAWPMWSWRKL